MHDRVAVGNRFADGIVVQHVHADAPGIIKRPHVGENEVYRIRQTAHQDLSHAPRCPQ